MHNNTHALQRTGQAESLQEKSDTQKKLKKKYKEFCVAKNGMRYQLSEKCTNALLV